MKYEKLEMDIILFDSSMFMEGSTQTCSGHTLPNGNYCGVYVTGHCDQYNWTWASPRSCNEYTGNYCGDFKGRDGSTCSGYDGTDTTWYGYTYDSCSGFECYNGF